MGQAHLNGEGKDEWSLPKRARDGLWGLALGSLISSLQAELISSRAHWHQTQIFIRSIVLKIAPNKQTFSHLEPACCTYSAKPHLAAVRYSSSSLFVYLSESISVYVSVSVSISISVSASVSVSVSVSISVSASLPPLSCSLSLLSPSFSVSLSLFLLSPSLSLSLPHPYHPVSLICMMGNEGCSNGRPCVGGNSLPRAST